jgi:hypothetical protein
MANAEVEVPFSYLLWLRSLCADGAVRDIVFPDLLLYKCTLAEDMGSALGLWRK